MPAPNPWPKDICTLCGADKRYCKPDDAFHDLLRRHDLHPWCWSDSPDAWLPLIDRLIVDLKIMGWTGVIAQIKEKFGELRFYAEDTTPGMDARIDAASVTSRTTCEVCGQQADVQTIRSWQRAICADCAQVEADRYAMKRKS